MGSTGFFAFSIYLSIVGFFAQTCTVAPPWWDALAVERGGRFFLAPFQRSGFWMVWLTLGFTRGCDPVLRFLSSAMRSSML
jgi:hypothetical protein